LLAVEPLNTRVDHVGYFLPSTAEALDIIDEVDRREVRILYDIYHSAVMGERIEEALDGRVDRIAHVHIADHPGRHEPGSGAMDGRGRLEWLAATTYPGMLGVEYKPTGSTEASLKTLLER
jgi:hydroxypyruvate isomerase